jgi:hypothetical protein
LSRRAASLRSYIVFTLTPYSDSTFISREYISPLSLSIPKERTSVISTSLNLSTVRPGKPSAREDKAAGVKVLTHYGFAIRKGIAYAPFVKGLVKAVVGIAGYNPDPDFRVVIYIARTQPASLPGQDINNIAVYICSLKPAYFLAIDPGVP